MSSINEYKYVVTIDGQLFTGYLRFPQTQTTVFGRKVFAYIELSNLSNLKAGVKKVTIEWPVQVFPYVLNPSNVIFKLDDEYILQHGITADIYNRKTEHIIAIGDQITNLHVYIFNDSLCQTEKTVCGWIGDIKECNTHTRHFIRAYNEHVTTECHAYTLNVQRSYNEHVTTECNAYTLSFIRSYNEHVTTECNVYTLNVQRSYNEHVTTECNAYTLKFLRSFDYSISLK